MSGKSDQLDKATELALKWATDILEINIQPADPSYLKIQALKAQASQLIGQLKARIDPQGLRGGKGDRVGDLLAKRLADAKAPKPN